MASKSKSIAELLNGDVTVTATDIADGSVITAKIADGNISTGKIADNAVTADKIVDNVALSGTTTSINGLTPQASNMQPYNMVINGAMTISQRGTSFTGLTNGGTDYTLDRWKWTEGGTPSFVMSVEQSSDAPAGFSNSLKTTTTTGSALAVSDSCRFHYWMEGNTTPHLAWGTATAKPLTVSFWVKSNVTGNYSVGLYFSNSTARMITSTYTINTANTWEYKTITFLGDTGLAPVTDNGQGLLLQFGLIVGTDYTTNDSTSWVDYDSAGIMYGQTAQLNTTNDTWHITGVQLEAGSSASSFAHENYSDTLRKCQRYLPYWSSESGTYFGGGFNYSPTNSFFLFPYTVPPRTPATGITSSGLFEVLNAGGAGISVTAGPMINGTGSGGLGFTILVSSGLVQGHGTNIFASNGTSVIYGTGCEL